MSQKALNRGPRLARRRFFEVSWGGNRCRSCRPCLAHRRGEIKCEEGDAIEYRYSRRTVIGVN